MNRCGSSKFNCFCYVCGKYTTAVSRRKITEDIADLYQKYFNQNVIRDVDWAPSIICTGCTARLNQWLKGDIESMSFGIPMIWINQVDHNPDNCYACVNYTIGMNRLKVRHVEYKETQFAQLPKPHSLYVPIPKRPSPTEEYQPPTFDTAGQSSGEVYVPSNEERNCEHIEVSQDRFDIIARRLKLSQRQSIQLAKELKSINILAPDCLVYASRGRHRHFTNYFRSIENNSIAFCTDIPGLVTSMHHNEYKPEEWRLFIDSSKSSLKAVLLHITNSKNSIPIAISSNTKETYLSLKKIIELVKYNENMWKISADLKVITLLRGMQTGYTKNMCFMCLWDTRFTGDQYTERNWATREEVRLRRHNIIEEPIVPIEKVLLPPLHIKLGIVKNFIKSLNVEGNAFNELQRIFPRLSGMKIKEGLFLNVFFNFL